MDYKNLVHESELKISQTVMRWRLFLKENGPEIKSTIGYKNVVTDALRRLIKQGDIVDDVDTVLPFVPVDDYISRVHCEDIQARQAKYRDLRQRIKADPNHSED